ncbi:S-adenosyl-L-methionine-dependent methyltransferase [Globomyces pollinis-pini]|nr:S-adenosyl-L-methionine-dependent methyltransferase [Globomyces pollinis-pini]
MKLPKLPSIRELLNLYQINPQKKLSQNFISNKYAQQFVKLNDSYHNQLVIEIGSGPGGLTRQLLSTNVKKLIGIEKDSRFEPILSQLQTASGNRFQYQIADILDDKDGALSNQILDSHHQIGYGVLLVGNLPFSISGLVLNQWIRQALLNQGLFRINNIELLLIFSNEVGQRLIPNHGKRTRFSALTQTAFQITDTMVIPNSGFDPVPNVFIF